MNRQSSVTNPVFYVNTYSTPCWVAIGMMFTSSVLAGEIYVSHGVNGETRWSTQALDASYVAQPALRVPDIASKDALQRNDSTNTVDKVPTIERQRVLATLVKSAAWRIGVNPALVMAVIEVESGYNAKALSPKGARGLMQLLPATAKRYGMRDASELYDPVRNVDMGTRHLKDLLNQHGGQWALAMSAYNAGGNAVIRHGQRIPAYAETMLYVPAVLAAAARMNEELNFDSGSK